MSAADAQRLAEEVVAACPELEGLDLVDLVKAVIDGSAHNLRSLEEALSAAGQVTPETACGYMALGAMEVVAAGVPEGDVRRKLMEAGRVVGRHMAARWARKIADELSRREGGKN